jgi:hypothetical protein
LYLGSDATPSLYLTGGIDEVGIWNTALSAGDITALYNSGTGRTIGTAGGGVLFAGADCLPDHDLNFHWDNTNKRLGIGTNVPASTLDVNGKAIFRDSIYALVVPYNSGAGIVALGIDTVAASPTFGKLVRKTAGGSTPSLQAVTDVGNGTTNSITIKANSGISILDGSNQVAASLFRVSSSGGGNLDLRNTGQFKNLIYTDENQAGNVNLMLPNTGNSADTVSTLFDIRRRGKSKGVFVAFPTSADTVDVWQTPVAITITSLKAILRGSSPSVTYNIAFGTNIQSPTAVFTADITCTSVTTGCSNSSGFNDATIPAGSFIWIYTNASSGTIRSIAFTINYTED